MTRRLLFLALLATACDRVPQFSVDAIDKAPILAHAPAGFLLGAATAPHQIEGGLNDDWTAWENDPAHIADHSQATVADDSWNKWPDDIAALKKLGANTYRFGIDWSRLEPTEGAWDTAAEDRYEQLLQALQAAHIKPMVTLFHFTLPRWVSDKGGWHGWSGAPAAFAAFSAHAATRFGKYVDLWCTINEPNVYVTKGYIQGIWPPGLKDQKLAGDAMAALIKGHALAAAALRANDTIDADDDGKATQIGIAQHIALFEPASSSPLDQTITQITDAFFNDSFPKAVKTGRIVLSVPGAVSINEPVEGLKGSFDWLGINYYTRWFVRTNLGDPSLSLQYVPVGRPKNSLGWDIYPEGLYRTLVRFGRYDWPIIITENGIADAGDSADKDLSHRPFFLKAHLYAVDQAMQDGVKVLGYYHWSLVDNFEWAEGFTPRFGLFAVEIGSDPTLARTARPNAVGIFQAAARAVGQTPE